MIAISFVSLLSSSDFVAGVISFDSDENRISHHLGFFCSLNEILENSPEPAHRFGKRGL